jgi:hypothetical protein
MLNLSDRRSGQRYDMELDMEFSVLKAGVKVASGRGKILNLSKTGILFESERRLPPESIVHIIVDWPVKFQQTKRIDWIVQAVVVRSDAQGTAVRIMRQRFSRQSRSKRRKMAG